MADGDRVAGLPAHLEPHESRQVLTAVVDRAAAVGADLVHRPRLDDSDGLCHPGLDDARVERHDRYGLPRRFVVARKVPALATLAEVHHRPVIEVGFPDLGRACLPRGVRRDDDAPSGCLDLELKDESQVVAVATPILAGHPPEAPSIPAIAQHGRDDVGAGHEQRGHIVSVGEQAVVVARPARCQQVVTDPTAVDADLVDAQRRDMQARVGDLPIDPELAPQVGRRCRALAARIVGQGDGGGLPVLGPQETRLDPEHGSPFGHLGVGTHTDPVITHLSAAQGPSGSTDADLHRARDLPGARDRLSEVGCS